MDRHHSAASPKQALEPGRLPGREPMQRRGKQSGIELPGRIGYLGGDTGVAAVGGLFSFQAKVEFHGCLLASLLREIYNTVNKKPGRLSTGLSSYLS